MSKRDRQRLSILIVLLVVLGMTVVLGYRMNRPQITAAVQTPETKQPSPNQSIASDARIRLDLIEKPESSQNIGRNNVFQYREGRPAPQTSRPGSTPAEAPPPSTSRCRATAPQSTAQARPRRPRFHSSIRASLS